MHKRGDSRDVDRRRNHVARLQKGKDWKDNRTLPPANADWPTCLIIAPSSVVGNWEREFETVRTIYNRNPRGATSRTIAVVGIF